MAAEGDGASYEAVDLVYLWSHIEDPCSVLATAATMLLKICTADQISSGQSGWPCPLSKNTCWILQKLLVDAVEPPDIHNHCNLYNRMVKTSIIFLCWKGGGERIWLLVLDPLQWNPKQTYILLSLLSAVANYVCSSAYNHNFAIEMQYGPATSYMFGCGCAVFHITGCCRQRR